MKLRHRLRSTILGPVLALGLGVSAFACTIPVFRFALDRWDVDQFRLVMPASWSTEPDTVRLLIPLRGNGEANVRIEENSDLSATEARLLFPHDDTPLWSGKLDATTLPALIDSPARRALLKHILSGDSVVWVVCTKEADKAEADRVEKRLRYLEKVATLPVQDPNDPDSQLGPGPPLLLKFTVLRVSLEDPAEKIFAAMIAGPKQQELIANGTAFAGPVFAKGRVLGSWPLEDLDDIAIEDATLFLIGRCSCRIKNQNPGWDVVLRTDWEHELVKVAEALTETDGASSNPAPASAETVISSDAPALPDGPSLQVDPAAVDNVFVTTVVAEDTGVRWKPIGAAALAALALIAGLMLWFKR